MRQFGKMAILIAVVVSIIIGYMMHRYNAALIYQEKTEEITPAYIADAVPPEHAQMCNRTVIVEMGAVNLKLLSDQRATISTLENGLLESREFPEEFVCGETILRNGTNIRMASFNIKTSDYNGARVRDQYSEYLTKAQEQRKAGQGTQTLDGFEKYRIKTGKTYYDIYFAPQEKIKTSDGINAVFVCNGSTDLSQCYVDYNHISGLHLSYRDSRNSMPEGKMLNTNAHYASILEDLINNVKLEN